jgi:spore coat protein U-like protein
MKKILTLMILITIGMSLYGAVTLKKVNTYQRAIYNNLTGFDISQGITVAHSGDAEDFFITISGGITNNTSNRLLRSPDGDTVNYQMFDNPTRRTILRDLQDLPSSTEVLSGSFVANEKKMDVEYYYSMPSGLFPAAAAYTDTLTVTLYSGTLNNFQEVESQNITVALTVRNDVQLSIVDPGGYFDPVQTTSTMDFGVLTSGTERHSDLIARSNTHFTLSLASGNGGVLKRTDLLENSEIPYSLYVNNAPFSLPAGQAVQIGESDPTGDDGMRYQVRVKIDDFWGVTTGTFEDVIQVTLSSQ